MRFTAWDGYEARLWVLAHGMQRCQYLARPYGKHFRRVLIPDLDTWFAGYRYSRLDKVVICADDPDWREKRDKLINLYRFPPDAFIMASWA